MTRIISLKKKFGRLSTGLHGVGLGFDEEYTSVPCIWTVTAKQISFFVREERKHLLRDVDWFVNYVLWYIYIYIYILFFFCCWESRHMIIMIWYDLVNQKKDMIWSCYRNVKWMTTFMMNYDSRCTLYIIIIYNKLITLSTKLFAFLIFVKGVLRSIWTQLIFVKIENWKLKIL